MRFGRTSNPEDGITSEWFVAYRGWSLALARWGLPHTTKPGLWTVTYANGRTLTCVGTRTRDGISTSRLESNDPRHALTFGRRQWFWFPPIPMSHDRGFIG